MMVVLDSNQLKEVLKAPQKKETIARAVRHQGRLRLHTEAALSPSAVSADITEFLEWVATLIPKDKYQVFVSLFRFPTPIIKLTSRIYNELERVFDGRNASFSYKFEDKAMEDDFEWYRKEVLHEPVVWRTEGWKTMKTSINAIVVVDLPNEQKGELPEPYFYFQDISNVIDYRYDGKIRWIVFRQNGALAVFDEQYYSLYEYEDDKLGSLISQTEHNLGYCPAQFFWSTPLLTDEEEIKKSVLSPELGNLDWLLFFAISKKHLDLYAAYPIYSAYARDCDYQNAETGDYCDGGFLRDRNGTYKMLRTGIVERCPVCSDRVLSGAGSFVEIPVPKKEADGGIPDMRNPVQITTIDRESLDYNVREQERLSEEIFNFTVGIGGKILDKEAVNVEQINATFEGKTAVLMNLKINFENAQRFVDETVARLRYGDAFLKSSVNWGTEFYVYTVTDLYEIYSKAKTNGASMSQLDAINDQIIATENRTNHLLKERMIILKQLEPLFGFSVQEVVSLYKEGVVPLEDMIIKAHFVSFVDRFERENKPVTDFGGILDLNQRVNIIKQKLKDYAGEKSIKGEID